VAYHVLAVLVENRAGTLSRISGLLQLLRPYGILELARTYPVALERGGPILKA
jgi:acetolactate synthase small subunit